jgi:predicted ATPase
VEAELVYQSGLPPQARYLFKHALVQDTAYQSLLKSRRQQLHQQVAQVLEEQFPQTVETQPELVAHHYTEAELSEQAIPYWQQAGQRASQRSAVTEAERHLTTALALLETLPDFSARTQQELALQTALGTVLLSTKGFAASAAAQAYERAWKLCQQMGETPQLFPVLYGLWIFSGMRGDLQTALAQAQHLFNLAQRTQDSASLAVAHWALGFNLGLMGDFSQGYEILKQGATWYVPEQHRSLADVYGFDPRGGCFNWMADLLWFLGYPEQARRTMERGLTLAHGLAHPSSLCFALVYASYSHFHRHEWQLTQEHAEAVTDIATEHEFPHWVQYGQMVHGYALAHQGQAEEGIAEIYQGLAGQRAAGTEGGRSFFQYLLAAAYGQAKQPKEGLNILTEALAFVDRTEERFYEAEMYRLKGELTVQSQVESHKSKVEDAEACFLKANEVARCQKAKSWELRATVSLARLWWQQGKQKEAHGMLAEIYGWFTEGFDTKDLQEAKALLEELARGV